MIKQKQRRHGDIRARAPRFKTEGEIIVSVKTIGTSIGYRLVTDDISSSGLLLTCDAKWRLPFITNTIIGMVIDLSGAWLSKPISCMGKVVRTDMSDESHPRFGVHIVQMNQGDSMVWERSVDALESRFPMPPQPPGLVA